MVSVLMLSGCFTYVRTSPEVIPVGQTVRLLVTPEGASEAASFFEVDREEPTLEGTLERREDNTLLLRVPVGTRTADSPRTRQLGQVVRIPAGEILAAELRELDQGKTGLLITGGIGLGALLFFKVIRATGGVDINEPPDIDLHLGKLFSIPIG
jgi:hypothetical protein